MKIQRNILYSKQKNKIKTLEKDLKEVETSDFPDKEFKVMVTKILTDLRRMDGQSKNFTKEVEYIRRYLMEVAELKNTRTKLKNTLEEINSSLDDAAERIREPEDRAAELTEREQVKTE